MKEIQIVGAEPGALRPEGAVARLHGLLRHLGHRGGWIVPKKYVEKVGEDGFKKAPVGAGPYKFVSFNPGVELMLEAFPDYWRKAPSVKRLVMKIITDESTRAAAVKTGEVDAGLSLRRRRRRRSQAHAGHPRAGAAPLRHLLARLPRPVGSEVPVGTTGASGWPPAWPSTATRINQAEMLGLGKSAGAFVPPQFDFALTIDPLALRPRAAKQLLAEAGYPNGFDAGDLTPLPPYTSLGESVGNFLRRSAFARACGRWSVPTS